MKPHTFIFSILLFGTFITAFGQDAQPKQSKNITVQIADFRGQGFDEAGTAAFQASQKDVVVVLVCGAEQEVIDETEAAIKGLIHDGYIRVAMIIADDHPTPDYNPFVGIIAGGDNPSYMTGVHSHALYANTLYKAVVSTYEAYILSRAKD